MNDLLNDPIFLVETTDSTSHLSLPEVLAALHQDRVHDLPRVRPHAEGPAASFLAALGALCMEDEGAKPDDPAWWRDRLLTLALGRESAWRLVVDDPARPAFMQPGSPEGAPVIFGKDPVRSPDGIDVLVTSKSWDQKATVMSEPQPEHWIWALVALQTSSAFLGRGNYGISRMNGGFSSRSMVGRSRAFGWGARWSSDVGHMTSNVAAVREQHQFAERGATLLWALPWDGSTMLDIGDLHPWCIEVCRRVRLTREGDRLVCHAKSTTAPRINAKAYNGVLGDPWLATHASENKAFTLGSRGFHYDVMRQLLTRGGDLRSPLSLSNNEGDLVWALGVAGGQGKTAGMHQRVLRIPDRFRPRLDDPSTADLLGEAAAKMVTSAGICRSKVLYPALLALLNHGESSGRRGDSRPDRFMARFEEAVDGIYFPHLWTWTPEVDEDDWLDTWNAALFAAAHQIFRDAQQLVPGSSQRGWKAIVAGERVLYGAARNQLQVVWREHGDDAA